MIRFIIILFTIAVSQAIEREFGLPFKDVKIGANPAQDNKNLEITIRNDSNVPIVFTFDGPAVSFEVTVLQGRKTLFPTKDKQELIATEKVIASSRFISIPPQEERTFSYPLNQFYNLHSNEIYVAFVKANANKDGESIELISNFTNIKGFYGSEGQTQPIATIQSTNIIQSNLTNQKSILPNVLAETPKNPVATSKSNNSWNWFLIIITVIGAFIFYFLFVKR